MFADEASGEETKYAGIQEAAHDLADERTDVPEKTHRSVRGRDLLLGVLLVWLAELALGITLLLWIGMPPVVEDHPVALLIIGLASSVITVLIAWLFVCRKYNKSFTEGFVIVPVARTTYTIAILIGMAMALVGGTLSSMFSTGEHMFERIIETPSGLLSLGILILLAPVLEEIYYRGFIFPVLQKRLGAVAAVVIVTLWFAVAHTFQSLDDMIVIPIIGAAGAVYTIQRWWTGSLTAPIVTHWTYNFCLLMVTVLFGF